MVPLYLETLLLGEVGHALVAVLRVLITEIERAAVLIAFVVVRGSRQAPRALRVDLAEQLQVHLVANGKVVATVTQVESAGTLIAVGRHDEAAGVALGEREETIGNGQRQWHVAHHQIGWSEDGVFARAHLASRERDIEVGMRLVAGSIAAVLNEHLALVVTLGALTGQIAVFLLGVHIADQAFLRLEVEGHRVVLVGVLPHLKHGLADQHAGRVGLWRGMHHTTVEAHVDFCALQVHVLIFHVGITIDVSRLRRGHIDQRVVALILHRGIDGILLRTVQTVEGNRVVDGFIVLIDGQFE